jgi:beta-hydroxylase
LDAILENRDRIPAFHQISRNQKKISKGDNWKTFCLYGFGARIDNNCARCPETARLLDNVPGLQNAMYSILAPGYHIPPHRGPTKAIIRSHLGLKIPQKRKQCWIRVDNEILHWEEGKCIVFDDSFEHEVYNNTDEDRVVLFFDVIRPMRAPARVLSKLTLSGIRATAAFAPPRPTRTPWKTLTPGRSSSAMNRRLVGWARPPDGWGLVIRSQNRIPYRCRIEMLS